jgi:glycosyltransferase involved in cell wall biosynthesis
LAIKLLSTDRNYFFMSDFHKWGGAVTFTAHLLKTLGINKVLRITKNTDRIECGGDFGYGLKYLLVRPESVDDTVNPFITDFFQYDFMLPKLRRRDVTIVIHDHTEVPQNNISCMRNWNIISIRKTFQSYLKQKYDLNSTFMYHPFYPYNIDNGNENYSNDALSPTLSNQKKSAISISRVDYGKNIDILIKANRILEKKANCDFQSLVKIYGPFNRRYVEDCLGGYATFKRYYRGTFPKSFKSISNILSGAKLVVDLSTFDNDGGGAQYTFLEAIHHGAALVINRKWIENVRPEYCDFKEGYNCYAAANENELSDLISNKKLDTHKVVINAKKLLTRHINADWSLV